MPVEIVMPRLSDTMESGTIARWLKHEGDDVKKGEPLADIETDKATMPFESYASGRLSKIIVAEGQSAPIGTPIAVITAAGEAEASSPAAGAATAEASSTSAAAGAGATVPSSPAAAEPSSNSNAVARTTPAATTVPASA